MIDPQLIEQICSRFEAAWQQCVDQKPKIETFLADHTAPWPADLLSALLEIELELLYGIGEFPSPQSLQARFPEHQELVAATRQLVLQRCQIPAPFAPQQILPQQPTEIVHHGEEEFCQFSADGTVLEADHSKWSHEVDTEFRNGIRLQGRYELLRVIGQGGMGTVRLAIDHQLHREVAIKIVQLGRRKSVPVQRYQHALREEARLGASLNDRAIATVLDVGTHAGRDYVVFEYVPGVSLREILRQRERLQLAEVHAFSVEVARALDIAHGKSIVHHDLKPENIVFRSPSEPRILDFGVAQDLQRRSAGEIAGGTPRYAAPEQVTSSGTDARTDQYALALIVYEMLAGRFAFDAPDRNSLLQMRLNSPPPRLQEARPDLPQSLCEAVEKALSISAGQRFNSCTEFVDAAFSQSGTSARAQLRIPFGKPVDVFLCNVSTNSATALKLSRLLEQHRLTTWFYQRDAVPGLSFRRQVTGAIHRAGAAVLVISEAAIRSEEFAEQVRTLGESHCPVVPLLVDISADDLNRRPVSWRSLLRSRDFIEVPDEQLRSVEAALLQTLQRLGRNPSAAAIPAPRSNNSNASPFSRQQPWETDSSQIDIEELPRLVFRNRLVDQFLNGRNCYFLSGTKGLGKTMLLSYKRHLLAQHTAGSGSADGLCLIPHDGAYLDLMSSMRTVSEQFESSLADLAVTRRFWSTALRVSAISHHSGLIGAEDQLKVREFPARFQGWLRGTRVAPSVVFSELTSMTISQVNQLVTRGESFLDEKLRAIRSATCFFIDKVDQAVQERSRAAWISIQAGLIEAAWEIMNANRHVRIYASIRQEAFANYHSAVKANIVGSTLVLKYSDRELKSMLDGLTSCYEDNSGFLDFVGLRVIKHAARPLPEDAFRFLRRHTFGRPRDFVAIARQLSASATPASEDDYCEIVRHYSGVNLVADIFEEMNVFLDCLADEESRNRFFQTLTSNIVDRNEALMICAEFNGIDAAAVRSFGTDSPEIFHPFGDLYLCGLLGVIVEDADTHSAVQRFRRPDDPVRATGADLPLSDWYLLHPALSVWLQQSQLNPQFFHNPIITAGDGVIWEAWDPICCEIARLATLVRDQNLRRFIALSTASAREHLKSREMGSLYHRLQSSFNWKSNLNELRRLGHEDLSLWLEELQRTQSGQ